MGINCGLVYNNACIVYLIMGMIKFLLKRNIFMPFWSAIALFLHEY